MTEETILNQEICRTCGKCCKEYRIGHLLDDDHIFRLALLQPSKHHIVEVRKEHAIEIYRQPCKALKCENGRYSCSIYGQSNRPKMCERYPLNQIGPHVPDEYIKQERRYCKLLNKILKEREGRVFAPFTQDQVNSLNRYQTESKGHPFTCGKCGKDLYATESGWSCWHCDYTQNWAHTFMADWSWEKKPSCGCQHSLKDPLHRRIGFLLWGISNPLWIWYGIRTRKKGIAILFAVYWVQNITGIWNNAILPIL